VEAIQIAGQTDSLRWVRRRLERLSIQRLDGLSAKEQLQFVDLCSAEQWFLAQRRRTGSQPIFA
jgi:hypothetical protein